jgi:MtN3 and saliva related transmembrane protein
MMGSLNAKVYTEMVGYAAATLTTVSFLPQLIRVVKLRSARDISLVMFCIFTTGTTLWLIYGLILRSIPMTLANGITTILSATILYLKLKYDRHATEAAQPEDAPR